MFTLTDSDLCLRTPDPASNDSVYMYIKHQCSIDIPTLKPSQWLTQSRKQNWTVSSTSLSVKVKQLLLFITFIQHYSVGKWISYYYSWLCYYYSSLHSCWMYSEYHFIAHMFYIHQSGVLTALFSCCMAGATWNCCYLCASFLYTIQPCTSLQCHFIQRHIGMVHACLAVTCHLYFWWNNWDLLGATGVTRVEYRNKTKSQHWRWTLEKKISCCSCRDLNPGPFSHESDVLTTELSLLPRSKVQP